jgi:hypothetical protein
LRRPARQTQDAVLAVRQNDDADHRSESRFRPDKDFAAVSTLGGSMSILAAHPWLPASNVKALIALAKAKPARSITPRRAWAPRIT